LFGGKLIESNGVRSTELGSVVIFIRGKWIGSVPSIEKIDQ